MAETIEALTVEAYDEGGELKTQELAKEVLTKGAWTTIMYLYQDINRKTGEWGPTKARIQRYQKRGGVYYARSKFNISSAKQAKQIIEILSGWFDDE